jgi:hypothetical protein
MGSNSTMPRGDLSSKYAMYSCGWTPRLALNLIKDFETTSNSCQALYPTAAAPGLSGFYPSCAD